MLLYPGAFRYLSISILIVACLCLTASAAIDLYDAYLRLNLSKKNCIRMKARRELKTKCYLLCGASLFLLGSVIFLPLVSSIIIFNTTLSDLGTWIFRFGSISYLISSYRSLYDLIQNTKKIGRWSKQDLLDLITICAFMLGALLYILGGIIGQLKVGQMSLMFEFWVMGSFCFSLGGFLALKHITCDMFLPTSSYAELK